MADLKSFKSYHSYSQFAKSSVPLEEVINEIAELPLDGVLGFVACLSLEMIRLGEQFDNPHFQGRYLQYALADDFPRSIPRAVEMISPGRVPITGGRNIFLHEQNLAWLCHYAILHSKKDSVTYEFTNYLKYRISRLLLIVNGFFNTGREYRLNTFIDRKLFVHDWVRNYQFNRFWRNPVEIIYKLTRQKVLFTEFIPKYFPDLDYHFTSIMGFSLQRYYEIVILIILHVYYSMVPGRHWLSKSNICSEVKTNRHEIDRLLARWTMTPQQYEDFACKWEKEQKDIDLSALFDFIPLRMTPLIEARPNDLVCPIPIFLFTKMEDEPYYILSENLRDNERNDFQKSIGYAYETYAHSLIERIANADSRGKWQIRRNPCIKDNTQLADSYLQRGKVAIVFEHKASRPGSEFLRGGEGERVIGPSDCILEKLEKLGDVSLKEGRNRDNGFLTRGMWQQNKAGLKIITWAEKEFGERPTRLIPIITHLSALQIDKIIRIAYIDPFIKKAKLYKDEFWIKPQWLHVRELEAMAQLAEDGELDLESLLFLKNDRYFRVSFDLFIHHHCGGIRMDHVLYDSALSLLDESSAAFFPNQESVC
ncbi:MAG: hypothetical protein PHU44_09000 [Syntrophales bacterium]|nr:hypothetical protein [Syntrophales bacterium]MDD5642045.1 hypothetical protein [Syntrophales bacterium]